ncbi:hypothetical protein VO63_09460 [Streptomyces showdoensis]|uniref:Uncharacterized protein n=2 Tax=Streptomyces showdoensis TaxID=68268 RepID=A0A2P2GRF7_STREW|nr:hypothetical protein [Streptomyces showdoensis]KKZ74092.1 hypothetical protein VO63_09460 [Streptomyces showdoensis]
MKVHPSPFAAAAPDEPPDTAQDTSWPGEARAAAGCAGLLLAACLGIDALDGGLETWGAALWPALAALLFVVLLPGRVSAAPGRLTVRGLWSRHTVRTDELVSVRWSNGVAQRLVLRDRHGARAELDPGVLVANPPLWHLLDTAARASLRAGTLLCGGTALDQLRRRIDRETAETVFRVSGL